jgi:hypothetical protein
LYWCVEIASDCSAACTASSSARASLAKTRNAARLSSTC